MTITYELQDSLYVNITNRCSNACDFCVRSKKDSVNGKDDLWLDREPTVDEIKSDFEKRDLFKYNEIVFCGYGEPLIRFKDVIAISRWLKSEFKDIQIRINTNGQANLIHKRDVTPDMKGLIDTVSISLNAKNAAEYQAICHSAFGENAFDGLLEFARRAKGHINRVILSVVDIMPPDDIEACRRIADDCGVDFRVRAYID